MMKESTKTMVLVGTAVVVLVLAWFSRPAPATLDTDTLVGTKIYDFDPLAARRLRIVDFNSLTGNTREFEVAMENGSWRIPSKQGYPADASEQMAKAANAINGKEILRVVSTDAGEHQLYGVLDPSSQQRNIGDDGVGTRVAMEIEEDEGERITADLIIGKQVKDQPEQRYVRWTNRDLVTVVEVDPENLSTSFDKWIEKDLLKLNPWDIQQVHIKDYTFEVVARLGQRGIQISPEWDHQADMTLVYDDDQAEWKAQQMLVWDPQAQQYVEEPLSEDQELDSETLNDLKTALDDLRIVDVARKPEGLSADLKAQEDFLASSNQETLQSLMDHGFAPLPTNDGTYEISSTDGEVIVTLNTGVEYVLRFGNVQEGEEGAEGPGFSQEEAAEEDAEGGEGLNRYIFVLARFNEDAIEKPETEELPPLPEGVTEGEEAAASDESAEESADEVDAAAADDDEDDGESSPETADAGAEAANSDDDAAAEGTLDGASEESTDEEDAAADEESEQSEADQILAERKRIKEENQRKLDEYEEKITQAKQTVQELNDRFGDWYYVVDNTEYKRIHLSRDQVVKEKEAEESGEADDGAVDAGGFGKPGEAVPGLPQVPGLLDDADESPTADPAADTTEEAATDAAQAPPGEPAAAAPSTDPAEDEPPIE